MDGARYLRTPEAAAFCGLSARTLEKLRLTGDGPLFHRPPGHRFVAYAVTDLEDWMRTGRRRSTSDTGTTHPA
jgi:predicted DNA-binding transcriptional regulator AlpA